MSDTQLDQFKATFKLFDTNQSGTITKDEMEAALVKMGYKPTKKMVDDQFAAYDTDKDGSITEDEFVDMMVKKATSTDATANAFKSFDENGDGFISVEELKNAMKKMGQDMTQEQLEAMIKSVDKDNDGKVNYTEFAKMMGSS
eukprot:TRINITY_DN4689_c0_g1_i2.p1 TRINITY_DN4689_c0_g1~~TRINITY_DN4689_c0_g1_i2.p1  ORF type:complete len:143 (+),score=43.28 TRINITY_DN4689_c0_g1_i2:60-488(+)